MLNDRPKMLVKKEIEQWMEELPEDRIYRERQTPLRELFIIKSLN